MPVIYRLNTIRNAWPKPGQNWDWILVAGVILAAGLIRMHLFEVPLERDEGEYAYAGQLILQGLPPYGQIYNLKMPGVYAAYALVMSVFGQTPGAIHLGLFVINAATVLLLFLLGRKLVDAFAGVVAAASFALLSMGQQVQGIFANAEHFVILTAVGGILLLVYAADTNKRSTLFAGSVLLGLSFIMKQHGVVFIAFGGLYLFLTEITRKPLERNSLVMKCLVFLAGVTLPFALTCLILYQAGVFDKFWFWTFDYASQYVSSVPLAAGIALLADQLGGIVHSSILIWLLAGIGLTSLVWNKRSRACGLFTALFSIFSFLAVCPGLYFRPHYFILLLPAVGFLAGLGVSSLCDLAGRQKTVPATKITPVLITICVLAYSTWQQREFLFFMEPREASRSTYGLNPFPESLEIARYIKNNSNDNDQVAILGSEPQIYFYSNRRSATGYIYTYALMESHPYALTMQREMIAEIERAKPKFLVFVRVATSWLVREKSIPHIFEWFNDYAQRHYELAGIVDIHDEKTSYLWDQDAQGHQIQSPFSVLVYRRK